MDHAQFWEIVGEACRSDPSRADDWHEQLQAVLMKLAPEEIIAWNHIFDDLAARAYTVDLWGAAYLINGGASDDGFYYFRCWLICMGRDVYEVAVANPDNLAEVMDSEWRSRGLDAEAETYAAAHEAWMAVTGKTYDDPYPARNERAKLIGEDWDFDDDEEARKRLPRLAALYRE